jgi:glyoxylase-like metal-dependent hydrolase (beta-lactamase superfamily II)
VTAEIQFPYDAPPAEGEAIEVAPHILWMRLPLPMALDHVNVFALDDGDGWTVVDTGFSSRRSKAIWQRLIEGPLAGKPIKRLIVTHYHPDHIGLAGWFQAMGVELLTSRISWLYARMLVLDVQATPSPEALLFEQRAGVDAARLAHKSAQAPFNFADVVAAMPQGFTRLSEGDHLTAGQRRWRVRLGQGHAPDHITLWSEQGDVVLGGDQFLPGISANIGVYPTEPLADPLGEWLDSTRSFAPFATPDQLILPGHKLPFTGLPFRLLQMAENHEGALLRLLQHLATPHTAAQCFMPLFKREIIGDQHDMALVEAVAHLNYLLKRAQVSRSLDANGAWQWLAL